jgi:tetratricopeptide (TPR) repeat protein
LYASSVGTKHFLYLQNENLRGQLLQRTGRRDPGLRLLKDTIAEIAVVRPASNTLANSLLRQGEAYLRDGSYEKALAAVDGALALAPAKQNISLLTRLDLDRAQILVALGRFTEAQDIAGQASQVPERAGTASKVDTAAWELLRASSALAQGDLEQAGKHIGLAQSLSEGETRQVRYQRAKILSIASRIAVARGDTATGIGAAAAALKEVSAEDLAGDVFLRAEVAAANGAALCSAGASQDGLRSADEALSARASIQTPDSALLAQSEIEVATCAFQLGEADRAEKLLSDARKVLDAHPDIGPQFRRAWTLATAQSRRKSA